MAKNSFEAEVTFNQLDAAENKKLVSLPESRCDLG